MAEMRLVGLAAVLCLAACGEDVTPPRHVDAPVDIAPTIPLQRRVGRNGAPPPTLPAAQSTQAQSIGLVASDDDEITAALARGAQRAIDEARDAGGQVVTLRVSEREARWGAAAEAAVRLALDEGAMAIITPPERNRAHAIAQFGTRAQVPIVSTSPAPTVMQAGSKWVTSVVPPAEGPLTSPPEGDWEQAGYDAAHSILTRDGRN